MKTFHSELACNYNQYAFGYTTYAQRQHNENRATLMEAGFLPYTGNPAFKENSYYMARSLRVHTASFEPNSENRRIFRKFEDYDFDWKFVAKEKYSWTKWDTEFCNDYTRERFSKDFDQARINRVINHSHCTHVCHIKQGADTIAILLLCCENRAWHYWFAFFSLSKFMDKPLGKWAMTSFLLKAHQNNVDHVYLGTCYGKDALYKVRDFDDISYFDGNQWVSDKKRLKRLCKNEEETGAIDLIKRAPAFYDNVLNTD